MPLNRRNTLDATVSEGKDALRDTLIGQAGLSASGRLNL